MVTILILSGYSLFLVGAFVPMFFDGPKRKLWLGVMGMGLALVVVSIVVYSIQFAASQVTDEPKNTLPEIRFELVFKKSDIRHSGLRALDYMPGSPEYIA